MNNLYRKLAWINIKSNKHFYLPYLLAGIVSVMMFYCMRAMQGNKGLKGVRGGDILGFILTLGLIVIGFFVCILLFYTNSFIMKRRKKELGVYNILGMEKRHIAKVMFWEMIVTFFISVGVGLLLGVLFHKFLTMFLYYLTGLEEQIPFYISKYGCLQTAELFGGIYIATFCYNFMKIQMANPIELLRSANTGEREPKTKIILSIVGVLCLGVAYYIAITSENPMEVILLFFVAIILVIIGTYCLFTAGSIALLKILRKNKKYYYQTRHFTAVSGMIYRMKQNAAGLANICILSTMVLVMISTTVSMYIGLEDKLNNRYTAEMEIQFRFMNVPEIKVMDQAAEEISKFIKEKGYTITKQKVNGKMEVSTNWKENQITLAEEVSDFYLKNVTLTALMTKENYERLTGTQIADLKKGEIALASEPDYAKEKIGFNQIEYQIAQKVDLIEKDKKEIITNMVGGIAYLIFSDENVLREVVEGVYRSYSDTKNSLPSVNYKISIDIDGTAEEKLACVSAVREWMNGWKENTAIPSEIKELPYSYIESRQEGAFGFLSLNGGLFFLGMFLGSMFLMVTVLIIYYKQISEGYEDKERFAIMQKVGMSLIEVKVAIRTQIQIVFFLPLVMATVHLMAAFPMLKRLLAMLNLTNQELFGWCLMGTVFAFGLIYLTVFIITSRSYYKIVGKI